MGDLIRGCLTRLAKKTVWEAFSLEGKKNKLAFDAKLPTMLNALIRELIDNTISFIFHSSVNYFLTGACQTVFPTGTENSIREQLGKVLKQMPYDKGGSKYRGKVCN